MPQFANTHRVRRACATIGLLLLGILLGRGYRHEPPPLVIQRTVTPTAQNPSNTQPAIITEQIYTCGARTKKGTPCSRRVHGPVRCWQHKGAAAMLPQEKLIIKE